MRASNKFASPNYEWYIKADTRRYAGKWIAIVDQKVVASGNDAAEVYKEAKRKDLIERERSEGETKAKRRGYYE